jgi:DNA-binding transcriptional regulator YdaS (Cro superfamily)
MALDRDHRFPTVLLGVSTTNLRQNIVNQREMTALRRSPT